MPVQIPRYGGIGRNGSAVEQAAPRAVSRIGSRSGGGGPRESAADGLGPVRHFSGGFAVRAASEDQRGLRIRFTTDLTVEDSGCFPGAFDTGLFAALKFLVTPTIAPIAAPAAGPTIGTGIATAAPIAAPAAASLTMSCFAAFLASVPAPSATFDVITLGLGGGDFRVFAIDLAVLVQVTNSCGSFPDLLPRRLGGGCDPLAGRFAHRSHGAAARKRFLVIGQLHAYLDPKRTPLKSHGGAPRTIARRLALAKYPVFVGRHIVCLASRVAAMGQRRPVALRA